MSFSMADIPWDDVRQNFLQKRPSRLLNPGSERLYQRYLRRGAGYWPVHADSSFHTPCPKTSPYIRNSDVPLVEAASANIQVYCHIPSIRPIHLQRWRDYNPNPAPVVLRFQVYG